MIIEERFELAAPPRVVADGLLDVLTVSRCVPGVSDVREIDDGRYEAVLQVQIGPLRAAFTGQLEIDRSSSPDAIRATGSGVDRSSGSTASVQVEATLRQTDTGTAVATVADVSLRGRLGQFGSGIIRTTSSELLRQFVGCFEATLAPPAAQPGAEVASPTIAPAPAGRLTLWQLVRATVVGLARRLAGRVRRRAGRRRAREGA